MFEDTLFTARKKGERTFQVWTTKDDAAIRRKHWEREGWTVTIKTFDPID